MDPKMDPAASLGERIGVVRARIAAAAARAGRAPDEVTLVAVTKLMPAERVREVYAAGLRIFGENRVQEAEEKIAALADLSGVRWELIGHLQTNKVATAVGLFARVQSVDSVRLAEKLEKKAAERGQALPVLLEVNVGGEASKLGLAPAETLDAARAIVRLEHLRPEGLMTVAPISQSGDAEEVRPIFRQLRELRDLLRQGVPLAGEQGGWDTLSMGMTDDFEVAIEEGATLVRVGRAIFGSRPGA
ncbi:MAG: Pyridoxal phosphate-containing protein YggS [Ktedonobacterales bacterium]|jgi:pyridoxal phosphate enzyme (YggS family)|nr:MAG: Pyridoxal phosphate-containing protein YggS [Ktedonobacterales bacterium]